MALAAQYAGDYERSEHQQQQALASFRQVGDRHGQAIAFNGLGRLAEAYGDYERARDHYETSLAFYQEVGGPAGIADARASLAWLACKEGQYERALTLARETRCTIEKSVTGPVDIMALEAIAMAIGPLGNPDWAIRLFGAAAALRESAAIPSVDSDVQLCTVAIEKARDTLPAAISEQLWAEGWSMPLEQLVAVDWIGLASAKATSSGG